MEQSSFLDEIQKKKQLLKTQETIVTLARGEKYVEKRTVNGELKITKLENSCFGYVVDEKPDLEIAEILPYLLLSSQDVVQHSELLKKKYVTHVLSIGIDIPFDMLIAGIIYKKINLLDLPEADILNVFEECFEFIESARMTQKTNKILVHCNAGYSRSPSIVIAYLMKKFGFSLEKAIAIVKEKRNIRPNDGFMNQLQSLETQLMQQNVIK